jgi:hypothetical protein
MFQFGAPPPMKMAALGAQPSLAADSVQAAYPICHVAGKDARAPRDFHEKSHASTVIAFSLALLGSTA